MRVRVYRDHGREFHIVYITFDFLTLLEGGDGFGGRDVVVV